MAPMTASPTRFWPPVFVRIDDSQCNSSPQSLVVIPKILDAFIYNYEKTVIVIIACRWLVLSAIWDVWSIPCYPKQLLYKHLESQNAPIRLFSKCDTVLSTESCTASFPLMIAIRMVSTNSWGIWVSAYRCHGIVYRSLSLPSTPPSIAPSFPKPSPFLNLSAYIMLFGGCWPEKS